MKVTTRTRRHFLKVTGAGVAGIGTLGFPKWAQAAAPLANSLIPPHRGLSLPGVHAYADLQSVAPGETVSFLVSSSVPYRLSVCRLGVSVDDPSSDDVLHEFPERRPQIQLIHPGSYVHIRKGLSQRSTVRTLSLECWVRPWKTDRLAGLIAQGDFGDPGSFGLYLEASGSFSFLLGESSNEKSAPHSMPAAVARKGKWHHLVGTWDGREKRLWLDGKEVRRWRADRPFTPTSSPLRLGASSDGNGNADHCADADLAMCVMYSRALSAEEISARFSEQGIRAPSGKDVLGCWEFSEERGDSIADSSRHRRDGRVINHGTWMIGGPSFQPEVPRFRAYDPRADKQRGHALRLASDDLYDCGWKTTHRFQIPTPAKSGIYVARIRYEMEGKPRVYHVTFIVGRPHRRKKAEILVLAATNTWRAYSGTPFAETSAALKSVWGTNGSRNSPGDPPAYCLYRGHAAGQGTYQLGLRVPWPVAGPYVLYGGATDYSHLMRADRFAQAWLEKSGYDFDVISDLDLHRRPDVIQGYKVFLINGHSEYWSVPMYRGLESYLARGGNLICLSGNSLFWRVTFNEEGTIMECRKVDAPGEQVPAARRGEAWHSHDGLRGGLLRECGCPAWKLIGLETLGWNNQSVDQQFGPYLIDDPAHFLFNTPEKLGLKKGDTFGQGPQGKLPRANGHEIDIRLSTLAQLQEQPAPAGAELPSDPAGIVRLANGVIPWKIGGAAFDYFFRPIKPKTDQGGELIYWERPEGGRVLNAGSIGAGWALLADAKFQGLLRNALFHFGVKQS